MLKPHSCSARTTRLAMNHIWQYDTACFQNPSHSYSWIKGKANSQPTAHFCRNKDHLAIYQSSRHWFALSTDTSPITALNDNTILYQRWQMALRGPNLYAIDTCSGVRTILEISTKGTGILIILQCFLVSCWNQRPTILIRVWHFSSPSLYGPQTWGECQIIITVLCLCYIGF